MADVIAVVDLCHHFPDGTQSLDNISLTVGDNEFIVVAGANGSGKTTLFKHLNGLLLPSSGNVYIDNIPVKDDLAGARKRVGLVFQDADSQIIGETVYDDVAFGPENLRLDRTEIDARVKKALDDVGLAGFEHRSPHHLSGGEKRLLAIAGVLAMSPQVLLMDEPFSNLDYSAACTVLKRIVELHGAGHTLVITTHDLEKVLSFATRLIVMQKGAIVCDGAPDEMVADVEHYGIRMPCSVQLGRGIQPWGQ